MLREPLVDERVIGRQQVEQAPVLAEHTRDEQLRLGEKRLAQRFIERKDHGIGFDRFHISQAQPLAREVGHQRVGARVVQHPAHLMLQHGRILQLPFFRQSQQLIVGNRAP